MILCYGRFITTTILKQSLRPSEKNCHNNIILFEHQKESQRQTSSDDYHSQKVIKENNGLNDLNDLNLEIESIIKSKMTFSMPPAYFSAWNSSELSTSQKIKNHFNIIERISIFVDEGRHFNNFPEEWLSLNFLIYKKYYLQRSKVVNFLNKYPMKNPFIIQNARISLKEVIQFMKTYKGINLKNELQIQNKMIKQKLLCYQSQFNKTKVVDKINLDERDIVPHQIIKELWQQFILTEFSSQYSEQKKDIRLCKILQMIFLISELNGKLIISFHKGQHALKNKLEKEYIKESRILFQKHILYKQY